MWKGAALGFGIGFTYGAGGQMYKNYSEGKHILTGKDYLTQQIEEIAAARGLYSGNKGKLYPETIDEYYQQMVNKEFKATGVGAFEYNEKIILNEGKHRIAAAIKYGITHNDHTYYFQMINRGNISPLPPSYNLYIKPIKIYPK